jgi:hypothetical protein
MAEWKFLLPQIIACVVTLFIIDRRTAMRLMARGCILVGNFFHWCAGVRDTILTRENVV